MANCNGSGVSFSVVCPGCAMNYFVTAEDVFNSCDFVCDQCGNLIDLIEVCGAALAQFSDDNLDDIWNVAQAIKCEQCGTFEATPFDQFL